MEHSAFNYIDLGVLGVLVVSGVLAFKRGFLKEVFALGTWVAATLISMHYYPDLKPIAAAHIKNELAANAVAGLGLFCVVLVILIPLGNYVMTLMKGPTLSSIDHSLGFVFGIVRGCLVLSLLFLCVTLVQGDKDKLPKMLEEAKSKQMLAYGAEILKSFVPEDKQEEIEEDVQEARDAAEDAVEDMEVPDLLAEPKPSMGKKTEKPSYDESARGEMNKIVDKTNAE